MAAAAAVEGEAAAAAAARAKLTWSAAAGGRQEADVLDTAGTAADIEAGEEDGAAGRARPVAASEPLRAAWEP